MNSRLDFRYSIPRPPDGPVVELSAEEAEKMLLKNLDEAKADPTEALWRLAHFYKQAKQHEKALERLRQLIQRLPDPEQKAQCVLTMGQAMEQVGDYPAAVRYYKEALALEPTHTFTWYFINNNLGFSLNTLGQFAQGEIYCRKAIEVDASRPNAHKNLGIALAGQGAHREAAKSFVAATQANAADPRAYRLLQDLLRQHPELEFEFAALAESCQKAVEVAAKKAEEMRPLVLRGWKKHFFYCALGCVRFGSGYTVACAENGSPCPSAAQCIPELVGRNGPAERELGAITQEVRFGDGTLWWSPRHKSYGL